MSLAGSSLLRALCCSFIPKKSNGSLSPLFPQLLAKHLLGFFLLLPVPLLRACFSLRRQLSSHLLLLHSTTQVMLARAQPLAANVFLGPRHPLARGEVAPKSKAPSLPNVCLVQIVLSSKVYQFQILLLQNAWTATETKDTSSVIRTTPSNVPNVSNKKTDKQK